VISKPYCPREAWYDYIVKCSGYHVRLTLGSGSPVQAWPEILFFLRLAFLLLLLLLFFGGDLKSVNTIRFRLVLFSTRQYRRANRIIRMCSLPPDSPQGAQTICLKFELICMGILWASNLKQNIAGNVDIFLQNKRKLTSIVVICRPCSCKWRILANIGDFEGLAFGVYLSGVISVTLHSELKTLWNRYKYHFWGERTTTDGKWVNLTFI